MELRASAVEATVTGGGKVKGRDVGAEI